MADSLKPRILLVDDEEANLRALERTLRDEFELTLCRDPSEALRLATQTEFAAVVSDQRMPAMLGTELLADIARVHPRTTRLILTGFTESQELLEAINRAEIYRYVTKPWDNLELGSILHQACERYRLLRENADLVAELQAARETLEQQVALRTEELRLANQRLSEQASTDPLTRVPNRRVLFQRFQEEIDRAERYERPITIAMVDVDHFKVFNDMEGHPCGDEALKKIAATLSSCLRKTDFIGRYGGEEFLVLMPETPLQHGLEIAGRLRAAVEGTLFQGKGKTAYLTVSLGIAGYPRHGQVPKTLMERADQALYEAKQGGRNRIVVSE